MNLEYIPVLACYGLLRIYCSCCIYYVSEWERICYVSEWEREEADIGFLGFSQVLVLTTHCLHIVTGSTHHTLLKRTSKGRHS